jgi:hypothetical protein
MSKKLLSIKELYKRCGYRGLTDAEHERLLATLKYKSRLANLKQSKREFIEGKKV